MSKRLAPVAMAGVAMLLAACGAGGGASSATTTGTSAPTSDAAAAPSGTASAEPGTGADARTVPAECAALDLSLGATLQGEALGACVATALVTYGSGRMEMTGEQLYGVVDFTYDPDYAFRVEGTTASGSVSMTYADGKIWLDSGDGPVLGDVDSTDPDVMLAGVAGEMYRYYSDPALTASLVSVAPRWTVADAREARTLPDGTSVDAFRIVNDEPFTWHDVTVSEFVLWYGDEWLPAGTQATSSIMGTTETTSQSFYDLGADITIEPLG